MSGRSEQLWVKKLGGDHFQVCCLPFFTYGIALRDVVLTTLDESEQFIYRQAVEKRGHGLIRFAFASEERAAEAHEEIHRTLIEAGLRHEWHAVGYGAIDITDHQDEMKARAVLRDLPVSIEVAAKR